MKLLSDATLISQLAHPVIPASCEQVLSSLKQLCLCCVFKKHVCNAIGNMWARQDGTEQGMTCESMYLSSQLIKLWVQFHVYDPLLTSHKDLF